MDPKVCGKLLTTHRRGLGDDVEAVRGGCPSSGAPEQAPERFLVATEACGSGLPIYLRIRCF